MAATMRAPPCLTVEWSQQVAAVAKQLGAAAAAPTTHCVLPDLPRVLTAADCQHCHESTIRTNRIRTIAVNNLAPTTFHNVTQQEASSLTAVDEPLIVGENEKTNRLSAAEAIQLACETFDHDVWCVANPNQVNGAASVMKKIEAGATGIIAQPLLASHAWSTLEECSALLAGDDVAVIAGLALPQTVGGLSFWADSPGQQDDLPRDDLFCQHLNHFHRDQGSLEWARQQGDQSLLMKSGDGMLLCDGVHCMLLRNTADLLSLINTTTKQ